LAVNVLSVVVIVDQALASVLVVALSGFAAAVARCSRFASGMFITGRISMVLIVSVRPSVFDGRKHSLALRSITVVVRRRSHGLVARLRWGRFNSVGLAWPGRLRFPENISVRCAACLCG